MPGVLSAVVDVVLMCALVALAALWATVAHELTHAALAVCGGRHVTRIDIFARKRGVWFHVAEPPTLWDWVIVAGPILIGGAAGIVVVSTEIVMFGPAGFVARLATPTGISLAIAWGVYTLSGLPSGDLGIDILRSRQQYNNRIE